MEQQYLWLQYWFVRLSFYTRHFTLRQQDMQGRERKSTFFRLYHVLYDRWEKIFDVCAQQLAVLIFCCRLQDKLYVLFNLTFACYSSFSSLSFSYISYDDAAYTITDIQCYKHLLLPMYFFPGTAVLLFLCSK